MSGPGYYVCDDPAHDCHEDRHKDHASCTRVDGRLICGCEETDPRARLLDDAREIVTSNRNKQYGEPEDNFRRIANLWNDYLSDIVEHGDLIQPHDVAAMMVLLKIARIQHDPNHRDSWLDAAGYMACGWSTLR